MRYILITFLLALFLLSACQPANQPTSVGDQEPPENAKPDSGEVLDTQGFTEALVLTGATVGQEGEIEQPFFSVPGQVITINGEIVQIFEYADAAQADAEAAQVAPDGSSIGASMASWVGPPHFFRSERLIVLYVGDNQSVIDSIETVLGPQFAGADTGKEGDLSGEPPAAILNIGEDEQVSGIGSYCWPTEDDGVGLCADTLGIPTSPEPILVESPFTVWFTIPDSAPPDTMVLAITPLEAEDRLETEVGGMYWWSPDPTDQSYKQLSPPYEIDLDLEPGLFLLNVFAQWEKVGDVSYGFLVEVSPTASSESPDEESEFLTIVVLAEAGLNLRSEPDLSSEVIGIIPHSEFADVIGQSPNGEWWQVVCPESVDGTCCVSSDPGLSEAVDLSEFSLAGLIYTENDRQPERPMWINLDE